MNTIINIEYMYCNNKAEADLAMQNATMVGAINLGVAPEKTPAMFYNSADGVINFTRAMGQSEKALAAMHAAAWATLTTLTHMKPKAAR